MQTILFRERARRIRRNFKEDTNTSMINCRLICCCEKNIKDSHESLPSPASNGGSQIFEEPSPSIKRCEVSSKSSSSGGGECPRVTCRRLNEPTTHTAPWRPPVPVSSHTSLGGTEIGLHHFRGTQLKPCMDGGSSSVVPTIPRATYGLGRWISQFWSFYMHGQCANSDEGGTAAQA